MTDPLSSSRSGRLRPGETIGRFRPLRELGRGGMGVVYEAEDPELGRRVALKLILAEEAALAGSDLLERFFREAEALARVRHPNLVTLHEWGRSPRGPFLVTELIDGRALGHDDARDPRVAAGIVRDVAGAVAALHDAGVLHRDLKPQNILLRQDGSPVLIDLGLARVQSADALTRTGTVLGTPAYMAPEQAEGGRPSELDGRVDVYGLGAVLFGLLAGRPPFDAASPLLTLKKVLSEEPAWPAAPRGLLALLRRAMSKRRERRHGSARELQADLDRWLREGDPLPRGPIAAGAAALGLAVLAVAAWPSPPTPQPAPPPRIATTAPIPSRAGPPLPARTGPAFAGPTVTVLDAGELGVPLVAFVSEDRLLVGMESPEPSQLRLLDLRRGRPHAPPDGLTMEVSIGCLAVDPVHRTVDHLPVAAVGAQRRHAGMLIELVDPPTVAAPFVVTDELRRRPGDPPDGPGLASLAFSPDGSRLACGTRAGDLVLIDAEKTRHPRLLRVVAVTDALTEVAALAFSPDGALLAVAACDPQAGATWLVLLDARDLARRGEAAFTGSTTSVAWAPDGRRLAASTRGCDVRLFEVGPALEEVRRQASGFESDALLARAHQGTARGVMWLGPRALASAGGRDVALWDVDARRELGRRPVGGEATTLALSPGGGHLAVGLRVLRRPERWEGRVELLPLAR